MINILPQSDEKPEMEIIGLYETFCYLKKLAYTSKAFTTTLYHVFALLAKKKRPINGWGIFEKAAFLVN